MDLHAFTDELQRLGFAKTAFRSPAENMLARAGAWGAAGGAGMYAGQKIMAGAGAAEDPAFTGRTLLSDTAKASLGAMLVAGILKALAHKR